MIFDKKVLTIMKVLIYQTVVRLMLLYGCETWTMSVKDEKRMTDSIKGDMKAWKIMEEWATDRDQFKRFLQDPLSSQGDGSER